jgi:hypothetical protein
MKNTWHEVSGENEKKEKGATRMNGQVTWREGDTWQLEGGRWTEEGPCYEVKWKIGCRGEAAREVT